MIPEEARLMAGVHLAVLPIGAGTKWPPFDGWQNRATDDVEVLEGWWPNGANHGVGWKMGVQPDGRWLFAIDVDVNKGGKSSLQGLIREFGLRDEFAGAVTARTGGGGLHFVFELPADPPVVPTNRSRLRDGLDVRAEGGQIVVAPSRHMETGVAYAWVDGKAPWQISPSVASAALMSMLVVLLAPPVLASVTPINEVERSRSRHPSADGFDPFVWLRDNAVWPEVLDRHGWLVHSRSGGDVNYTRPGKSVRDGKSAVLHESGAFVVFTTDVPGVLEGLGHPTVDGSGFTVSIVEFVCAYEFGGDMKLLGRSVRERFGPARPALRLSSVAEPVVSESSLSPDREFYDQRPWMAMCRQMAESAGGSPSAHLLAFLTRWATLIPPGYSIPAINGAPSSFDLLSVIAGTSGAGKTSPMRNAAELLPVDNSEIRLGLGIGSGEGIIEAFYGIDEIEGEDGKKRKERRKMFAGVNFAVSEGLIFAELAGRGGTTHVTRLCDAWSGSPLSTANASAETFRHIDVDQYRLTLMMGIQVGTAHELMTDSATAQGFVGRLLFAWAEEPRVKPRPRRPEVVMLQPPSEIAFPKTKESPKRYQPRFLSYPDEVYAECQDASDARVGTNVPVEDHHHDLLRCKIAGIVALMDGRIEVSLPDWSIATTLVEHSAATRRYLREHRRLAERDRRHSQAVARAEVEIVVEDVKERQAIARMADAIRGKVDAPWGRNQLARAVSSGKTRPRFDAALKLAIANGWVTESDGRVEKA